MTLQIERYPSGAWAVTGWPVAFRTHGLSPAAVEFRSEEIARAAVALRLDFAHAWTLAHAERRLHTDPATNAAIIVEVTERDSYDGYDTYCGVETTVSLSIELVHA